MKLLLKQLSCGIAANGIEADTFCHKIKLPNTVVIDVFEVDELPKVDFETIPIPLSNFTKKDIGAHSIFFGQVRVDVIEEKTVAAIEYTAYDEIALQKMHEIREAIFNKYELTCMHVYHNGVLDTIKPFDR